MARKTPDHVMTKSMFDSEPAIYLLITIGSTGSVRWAYTTTPAVPVGHVQPGEVAFVINPVHAESKLRNSLHKSVIALEDIEEIDRSARAYGYEIGRGHPLAEQINGLSGDNPFLDPDWRNKVGKGE